MVAEGRQKNVLISDVRLARPANVRIRLFMALLAINVAG
jgi:hypothetical protein